ncbi:cation:proton antiporter [Oceanobacillus massiliensis]|uniref:cation:proton antiporter n=1 Tax=Oceanobacillus massiliensis TaxID=1465765 RepID=UPI000289A07A|nr:cation:proton antiporter [Oceanobacillus massiliensis]
MEIPELLSAGILILILFVAGITGMKFKTPGIILFIIAGIIVGGFLSDTHLLEFAGEVGIVLLFFMMGMEFPITQLLSMAKKVLASGLLDLALNLGVTTIICMLMGLGFTTSLVIGGVVYATSSTITAKMLENTKRMANPESEYMLGLLIFEDIIAPIVVAILLGMSSGSEVTFTSMGGLILTVIVMIAGAVLMGKFIFRRLGPFFEKYMNDDIFILFIIGMALTYGGLAVYLNLSEVLGAFLAGIMIAEVRKSDELEEMVIYSRDLLMPVFFLYFGTTITLDKGVPMIHLLIVVLLWSIVAKIITGYFGGKWYGLSNKVSLRAGLSLTQRGEFSIIIVGITSGTVSVFGSIYILLSAIIGVTLFQLAPKLSKKIFT